MKTIIQLTRKWIRPTDGLIGVEIEVEGNMLPRPNTVSQDFSKIWKVTQDGSLRGEAWEYVFNEPLSLPQAELALQVLEDEYKRHASIVDDSVRTGIHVHINVQDLTLKQLFTLFTVYYALEEVLVAYCGEDREGNHFCLRACDAEYIVFALYNALISGGRFKELASDEIRYSAMNVSSLFKYGSLEFRALRSTRDMKRILSWVKALIHIKEASLAYDNPRQVVEALSLNGAERFAQRVLGDVFPQFACPNLIAKIYRGVRTIQEFAFLLDLEALNNLDELDFFNSPNRPNRHEGGVVLKPVGGLLEAPLKEGVEGENQAPPRAPKHAPRTIPGEGNMLGNAPLRMQWMGPVMEEGEEIPEMEEELFGEEPLEEEEEF